MDEGGKTRGEGRISVRSDAECKYNKQMGRKGCLSAARLNPMDGARDVWQLSHHRRSKTTLGWMSDMLRAIRG